MAETTVQTEATPHDGSLESASHAISGLLSVPTDKERPAKMQPEQVRASEPETPEPEQVPAAPETDEESASEQAAPQTADPEAADAAPPQPKTWKVPVAGEEVEVTEDELLKGYSRTADYTRKTQELAKQRKEWEDGEAKAAREVRAQQQQLLTEMKTAIQRLTPVEPNWEQLRNELPPDQFAQEVLNWKKTQDHIGKIDAEQARLAQEADADAQKGFAQYVQEQHAHLERELPEMKDPEKAVALKTELATFAKSRGFTDQDLQQVVDHRVVLLLHDAMQHQKAKAKAPEIKNKIEKAVEASSPGNRGPAPKKSDKDAAIARVRKTGSIEDGAAAIAHLI